MSEISNGKTIRILIVEPGKHPRPATIPHTLKEMQKVVGGYIQAIYPWEDQVALVCDEEGMLKGYTLNRMIAKDNVIAGTFFICGLGEEDFRDLSDELMEKYERMFYQPQVFLRSYSGLTVYSIGPLKDE